MYSIWIKIYPTLYLSDSHPLSVNPALFSNFVTSNFGGLLFAVSLSSIVTSFASCRLASTSNVFICNWNWRSCSFSLFLISRNSGFFNFPGGLSLSLSLSPADERKHERLSRAFFRLPLAFFHFSSTACCSFTNDCSSQPVKSIDLSKAIWASTLRPVLPVVALGFFRKTFFSATAYPLVITLLFQHFQQG